MWEVLSQIGITEADMKASPKVYLIADQPLEQSSTGKCPFERPGPLDWGTMLPGSNTGRLSWGSSGYA